MNTKKTSSVIAILCAILCILMSACSCDHEWKETGTTSTCTEDGVIEYICTLCEKTYEETEPASGHEWSKATCTSPDTCTKCGEQQGKALGHSHKDWELQSTDLVNAVKIFTRRCAHCNVELDSRTERLSSLVQNGKLLLTPDEFCKRLNLMLNEVEEICDASFSARMSFNTSDEIGCVIRDDNGDFVGVILFTDNQGEALPSTYQNTPCISKGIGTFSGTEIPAQVFLALITTCDPRLDLTDATDIAMVAVEDVSCPYGNVTYVWVHEDYDVLLGFTVAN